MVQVSFWDSVTRALGIQAGGLGLGREGKIRRLIADLKNPLVDARRSAAWSLGKLKPPPKEAIGELEKAAKDQDINVRHAAEWALNILKGKK